jgi:hypothetical protein
MIVMFRRLAPAAIILVGLMATAASAHPHSLQSGQSGLDCGVWADAPCFGPRGVSQWRNDELGFRTTCDDALGIVRDLGYRKVRAAQCGVRAHNITGWRSNHRYLIRIDGYNGNISSIQRLD